MTEAFPALDPDQRPLQAPNITDAALVFEGGAMRGGYSAGILGGLIADGLIFEYSAGISAGSSCAVNYAAQMPERARKSFVDIAADPNFGDLRTFLRGKGLFNAEYLYEGTSGPGQILTYDMDRFARSGSKVRLGAFNTETLETEYFTERDIHDLDDLVAYVRASSSVPIMMPPTAINGVTYVDGALGSSGGIPVDVAERDGYDKFLIVLTRPRDYTKKPMRNKRLLRTALRNLPGVADATIARPSKYNEMREYVKELERAGKAYVIWAEDMGVTGQERNVARLQANFDAGRAQYDREADAIKEFFGVDR